jgi:hypothetical protein
MLGCALHPPRRGGSNRKHEGRHLPCRPEDHVVVARYDTAFRAAIRVMLAAEPSSGRLRGDRAIGCAT